MIDDGLTVHIVYMKSIEWTKKRKPLGITWVMRIYAMNGDNELFVTAIRNFAKSANVSGNRFAWENIKPYQKV